MVRWRGGDRHSHRRRGHKEGSGEPVFRGDSPSEEEEGGICGCLCGGVYRGEVQVA